MYDFDLPDGMSPADFRRHPIHQLIGECAHHGKRGVPSEAELDALRLAPADRRKVAKACIEAAAQLEECGGVRAPVWEAGERAAAELIGELPTEQQDPAYMEPADTTDDMSPEELAAQIQKI